MGQATAEYHKVEPATEQLLESIGTFFSAGVTPRQSSILRYGAYRMPSGMGPKQKRQHLRLAAKHLEQYSIVATEGAYAIPEPRLLPLLIDARPGASATCRLRGCLQPRPLEIAGDPYFAAH